MASAPQDVSYNAQPRSATPAKAAAGWSTGSFALAVVVAFIVGCGVAGIAVGISIHFSERAKDTKTTETKVLLREYTRSLPCSDCGLATLIPRSQCRALLAAVPRRAPLGCPVEL